MSHHHHARASGDGHAHDHHHDHSPAGGAGNRGRLLLAAVLTTGFMIAEAVGGFLTGSLALLADAGHMLTDSVALILAYVAYRVGERPGTGHMTYGFDRLKILVAYTNGLTIFAIAVWIAVEAGSRLAEPQSIAAGPMLAIAAGGLVVNLAVFAILHGGDRSSLNLRGALLHVLGDLLGSVAAIAAALVILLTGWLPADPLLSVLVALLLVVGAVRLVREAGVILLEGTPRETDRDAVSGDVEAHVPGISGIHHMHIWTLDGRRRLATLHACLAAGTQPETAIAAIKLRLRERHGIAHATVEVEQDGRCADDENEEMHGTS